MKKLLTILLILTMTVSLAGSALALADDADIAAEDPALPVELEAASDAEASVEPAPAATSEPEPDPEPEPQFYNISVSVDFELDEAFQALKSEGGYEHAQQFWINNRNSRAYSGSIQISTSMAKGFGVDVTDYAFYIMDAEGVPTKLDIEFNNMAAYSSAFSFSGFPVEPGRNYAVLLWNGESDYPGGAPSMEMGLEMNDELWAIYRSAMAGREDETWYEPYIVLSAYGGVEYVFEANVTEDYPYSNPSASDDPGYFGPESPVFIITIVLSTDGTYVDIQEPMYEPSDPVPPEEPAAVTMTEDGKYAQCTGSYEGLYVRIALTIDNCGESGLYITPGVMNDGMIVIPQFDVPGLTVTGVCVALVPTQDDITVQSPSIADMDYLYF